MKVALIPPLGMERWALESRMHLALATPTCLRNDKYVQTYQLAARRGDYVIMDNGAAEGAPAPVEMLNFWARKYYAHEIVMPDVIGNRERTMSAVLRYVEKFHDSDFKHMAVLHGGTIRQIMNTVDKYADDVKEVDVLGLPRVLVNISQSARIDLANEIHSKHPNRFELHMLGAMPSWPTEIRSIARYAPFVRSMDTSLPFNFALAGKRLIDNVRLEVHRPAGYHERAMTAAEHLVLHNISTYLAWANVTPS